MLSANFCAANRQIVRRQKRPRDQNWRLVFVNFDHVILFAAETADLSGLWKCTFSAYVSRHLSARHRAIIASNGSPGVRFAVLDTHHLFVACFFDSYKGYIHLKIRCEGFNGRMKESWKRSSGLRSVLDLSFWRAFVRTSRVLVFYPSTSMPLLYY